MGEWGPAEDGPVEAVLHGSQPGSDLLHEGGDAGPVSHVYPPEETVGIMSRALIYVFIINCCSDFSREPVVPAGTRPRRKQTCLELMKFNK